MGMGFILGTQEMFPVRLVTNPSGTDGFGAQFLFIISAVVDAELHNNRFVYTPFKTMEHNYDNDSDFLAKKEWLINFIDNFERHTTGTAIVAPQLDQYFYHKDKLVKFVQSAAFKKIKTIFRANKNINNYFNPERFNIAVHVRRPNSHDTRLDGADTPDDVFVTIINKLRAIYSAKNPLFHVYTQGTSENFKNFNAPDIMLHLNEPIEDSFTAMVFADALVVAKSTFSYVACLLSDGAIYQIPFPGAKLPHWIQVSTL